MLPEHPIPRALTLIQPWATLLLVGPKTVENRGWAPTDLQNHTAMTVLIHAGRKLDLGACVDVERATGVPCDPIPQGAVIGAVTFTHALRYPARAADADSHLWRNPWASGPWCWMRGTRWGCQQPVPARGRQGLWKPDEELWAAVRAQLVEV
jgi:hypothetical protein